MSQAPGRKPAWDPDTHSGLGLGPQLSAVGEVGPCLGNLLPADSSSAEVHRGPAQVHPLSH